VSLAERLIGKLDGITQRLPDIDFFISMYKLKDATNSSHIEGTRATMMDVIELSAGFLIDKESDANDIKLHIDALNFATERLQDFPFSLRFIRDIHQKLMH
jgi:Fic family protein